MDYDMRSDAVKRLIIPLQKIRYPEDVARIVSAANEAGYEIDDETAQWAWEEYSHQEWCAGWLGLRKETNLNLVDVLLEYLEVSEYVGLEKVVDQAVAAHCVNAIPMPTKEEMEALGNPEWVRYRFDVDSDGLMIDSSVVWESAEVAE